MGENTKEDINKPTCVLRVRLTWGGTARQWTASSTQVSLTATHPGRVSLFLPTDTRGDPGDFYLH